MRFHQLPAGACFEYKGVCYHKINNLTASPEQGGKDAIIPRSAEVHPVDEAGPAAPPKASPEQRLAADLLKELYEHCSQCLEQLPCQVDTSELAQEMKLHYLALRARALSDGSKPRVKSITGATGEG